jgi:hypothetical protein
MKKDKHPEPAEPTRPNPREFDGLEEYEAAVKAFNEIGFEKLIDNDEPKLTLFDLIDRFPEPYRTWYSNPINICKELQAACRVDDKEKRKSCLGVNPPGSISYFDRCKVHQIVSDQMKKHPEWINKDFVRYLKKADVNQYSDTTFQKWVSEVKVSKKGRPRGSRNLIKR